MRGARKITTRDFCIKWGVYALAVLPVWFLETTVLNRFPVYGVIPMLLPLAAVAVAVLEGAVAGAGFGLFVGVLCDAVYFGASGGMTVSLAVLGACAGGLAQYALRQNLLGCLVCSAAVLVVLDGLQVLRRLLLAGDPLPALLRVAVPEVLWSLVFVFPVYAIFRWVHKRVPESTHF